MTRREGLDAAMRDVLRELELMSHVPASGYQPTGRSRSSDEPPGGTRPPGDKGHTYFARAYGPPFHERTPRYPGCLHDSQRAHVIESAQAEVDALKGRAERPRVVEESAEQLGERIVREGEGFSATEVAVRFRTGERRVRRVREAAGREPVYGRPLEAGNGGMTADARRARARQLREDENLPITSIARILGVNKSTVSKDLRRG